MKKIQLGFITAAILTTTVLFGATVIKTQQEAPNFTLKDTMGKSISLKDYKGKYVVLEWTNPECPFVKKHYDSGNMQKLQEEFVKKDVIWLSICSSAKGKQGFLSNEEWATVIKEKGIHSTAVLLDPTGTVGKSYGAKTTPHIFIVDPKGTLIYQGAIDDKPSFDKEDIASARNYVRETLTLALSGLKVNVDQTESYGCSVKY